MPSQKSRMRNEWDENQRTVLHLLAKRADLSWPEKTRIFNSIFKEHLFKCGFPNGLVRTTLYVQYSERRKEKRANIWRQIISPSSLEKVNLQSALIRNIEQKRRAFSVQSSPYFTSRSQRENGVVHKASVPRKLDAMQSSTSQAQQERSPPMTPLSKAQSQSSTRASSGHNVRRGEAATISFPRRTGVTLKLTPTEYASTRRQLIPVARELAHPRLTGLLFRYWHNKSAGLNSTTAGFVAGRFISTNVTPPPPPKCETFDQWSDVFIHLNGEKIATPFISLSNSFAWTCRQALAQYERVGTSVRITVINASVLDRGAVFHAKPYHMEMKKKYAFTNGAHRYPATHELLVWHEIPTRAVLGTFTVQDLFALEGKDTSIAAALRLRELGEQGRGYRTTILPRWMAEKVDLNDGVLRTIAELCKLVQLDHDSIDHIAYLVSEYVSGWGIIKPPTTTNQWLEQASKFAGALVQAKGIPLSTATLMMFQTAYLLGVQISCGDANALFQSSTARVMRKRAKVIGIDDPTQIVAEECHNALTRIFSYDNLYRELLNLPPNDHEVRGSFQQYRADVDFRGQPRAHQKPIEATKTVVTMTMPLGIPTRTQTMKYATNRRCAGKRDADKGRDCP